MPNIEAPDKGNCFCPKMEPDVVADGVGNEKLLFTVDTAGLMIAFITMT